MAHLGDNAARLAWNVYAAGAEVARHSAAGSPVTLSYEHASPQTGGKVVTDVGGYVSYRAELDPLGVDVTSPPDPALNRSFDYDEAGRLWEAHSGNEADEHAANQPFPKGRIRTKFSSSNSRGIAYDNISYGKLWGRREIAGG